MIPGGVAIGLEGSWGTGKSTIVNLLQAKLADHSDTRVFVFDAWAHEGDPLRRSFLERLIAWMRRENWLRDRARWDRESAELSGSRSRTTTRPAVTVTRAGYLGIFVALLVPIGASLLATVAATAGQGAYSVPETIWLALIGAALLTLPITAYRLSGSPNLISIDTIRRDEVTTTTRSEPTSVEFEDVFRRLIEECVGPTSGRKLVIVIDNLDRLEPRQSVAIWSTLQTFLGKTSTEPWLSRVTVLLPYAPEAIGKLWGQVDESRAETTEAFLEKSLQLRFEVPPPALADWRAYLHDLLDEVLPEHSSDEIDAVVRLCSLANTWPSEIPTPRNLQVFANALGAQHRLWAADPELHDLEILALYELVSNAGPSQLIHRLRSGQVAVGRYARMTGRSEDDITGRMAALALGTTLDRARHMVLAEPLSNALVRRDPERLAELANVAGFWDILESSIPSDAQGMEALNVAATLGEFATQQPGHADVIERIRSALARTFPDIDAAQDPELVAAALRFLSSAPVTRQFLGAIEAVPIEGSGAAEVASELVRHLGPNLRDLSDDGKPLVLNVPIDTEALLQGTDALAEAVSAVGHAVVRFPRAAGDALLSHTEGRTAASGVHELSALFRLAPALPQVDWTKAFEAILSRLRTEGVNARESERLLNALHELRPVSADAFRTVLEDAIAGGLAFHYMKMCEGRPATWAHWAFHQLELDPAGNASEYPWQANEGRTLLHAAAAAPAEHAPLIASLAGRITASHREGLAYEIQAVDPLEGLALSLLRAFLETEWAPTTDEVIENWHLFAILIAESEELAKRVINDRRQLTDALTSRPFSTEHEAAYRWLEWTDIRSWAERTISEVAPSDLIADMLRAGQRTQWAIRLAEEPGQWPATHPVRGALVDYIAQVGRGASSSLATSEVAALFSHLDISGRDSVVRAFVTELRDPSQGFFDRVGSIGIDVFGAVLLDDEDTIEIIEKHIRARRTDAISWSGELIRQHGRSLAPEALAAIRATTEAETRATEAPATDELHSLAEALGIQIASPTTEETSDAESEEDD